MTDRKKRRFQYRVCSLRFDSHCLGNKPCRGNVVQVGQIGLCCRHRKLLAAIVRDAVKEGSIGVQGSHPRYVSRSQAA